MKFFFCFVLFYKMRVTTARHQQQPGEVVIEFIEMHYKTLLMKIKINDCPHYEKLFFK